MRRPWNDEDRQRYRDRDILRSRKVPGRKPDGPDEGEWGEDDRKGV